MSKLGKKIMYKAEKTDSVRPLFYGGVNWQRQAEIRL